ncbi:unnamed protein product, partial [Discosporangium mesarthrocarpum]
MTDTFLTMAYAIAAGSIGFALAIALTRGGQRGDRSLYFCLALTALLAHVLGQLVIVTGAYRYAPHLVGADLTVKMVLGPAVYFFARALMSTDKPRFGGFDWLVLLGPVLVLVATLPFASLSAEQK